MNQHPLSAAFPAMSTEDFQALKDSIESIGVQNPITTFEGMVIDGWHRYTAASELGMNCPVVELADVDPRDFVLAQNKARRHVTQAQLAMATTAVYDWKPHGGAMDTQCPSTKSAAELASISGVHPNTIKQAKVVQTKAAPEVIEAVKKGEIGLPKAAKIANLPKEEQAAAISKPVAEIGPKPEELTDDSPTLEELVDELQADNTRLTAEIKALEADDQKAETIKWHRMYEHAMRAQNDALRQAASHQKNEKRLSKQVRDCCDALGLNDPRLLVSEVKRLAARREAA